MPSRFHRSIRSMNAMLPRGVRGPLTRLAAKVSPPKTEVVTFVIPGEMKMQADLSELLAFQLFVRGEFQPVVTNAILNSIRPSDVVLDIGAHFGYVTLRMAEKGAFVHAFEPGDRQFEFLKQNVEMNHLETQTTLTQAALLDKIGEVTLISDQPGNLGHSYVSMEAGQTPATTLDAWSETANVAKVDFVKIDVEGAELLVLRGGEKLFARSWPRAFVYECNGKHCTAFGYTEQDVHDWFKTNGYRVSPLHKHDFLAER